MKMTDLESPFTGGPVEEVVETRTYEMRGQQLTVDTTMYRCVDTGELFTSGEQDEATLTEMYRQYRERNRIPGAAILKRRRKELGISAREASQLLGIGINQFSLYEAGELPTEAMTHLLHFFCDPQSLQKMVSNRMHVLPAKLLEKLHLVLQAAPQIYGGTLTVSALAQPVGYVFAGHPGARANGVASLNEEDILRMYNSPQARQHKPTADYVSS